MKKTVYIETTIVSYLTSRGSRDLVSEARRQLTLEWWDSSQKHFDLFSSPLVLREVSSGDPVAADKRVAILHDVPKLELTDDAVGLANALMKAGALPEKAKEDALHIATAAVCSMDYLLTWNCRHIDNAQMKPVMRKVCLEQGFRCPEICTPEELGGENDG